MSLRLDDLDRKILTIKQTDTTVSLDELAKKVGSSRTPVWNRLKKYHDQGLITAEVALLDAEKLGFEATFFVLIRTAEHDKNWQVRFINALNDRPEVLEAHRLAGDIDYIIKVQVKNAKAYDDFYQSLISEIKIYNVTALLSMDRIKETTALPIATIKR